MTFICSLCRNQVEFTRHVCFDCPYVQKTQSWLANISKFLLTFVCVSTIVEIWRARNNIDSIVSFSLGRSAPCLFFRRSLCITGCSSTELLLICRIFSFLKLSKSISSLLLQKESLKCFGLLLWRIRSKSILVVHQLVFLIKRHVEA